MTIAAELQFTHRFDAPLDDVLETLCSAAYARELAARHAFFSDVEVLSMRVTRARVERSVRYRARPFIARLGPFSPAPEWFEWVEHSQLDRPSATLTFENVPTLASVRARFENRGTMHFHVTDDRFERRVTRRDARFTIGFRLTALYRPLGEVALALVARQLERALDDEAGLLARFLAGAHAPQHLEALPLPA